MSGIAPSILCSYYPTFIGTSSDRDLRFRVQGSSEEWGVRIRDGFLETRATLYGVSPCPVLFLMRRVYLGRGVLVAFHTIQRLLSGVNGELRGVVTTNHNQKSVPGSIAFGKGSLSLTRNPGPCSQSAGPAKRRQLR